MQTRPKGGKKYAEKKKLVTQPSYSVDEAAALVAQMSVTAFDATAEAHFRILADMTQADQLVRGTVSLPHGTGKNVRVVAFVTEEKEADAKKAGAEHVGSDDLVKKIEGGFMDFDVAVAMPQLMKNLGKLAKTLGPKGLMPNPKSGTVTDKPIQILSKKYMKQFTKAKSTLLIWQLRNLSNILMIAIYPQLHIG
jgi:large subunit ribosomal protein L1